MKSRHHPIIRLFVSSTFSDMKLERDALQRKVFPELEQFCLLNRFQFQAIDLRWGISTEAGLDHRTMRICLEELKRSQEVSPEPNFLILLGNRYGWRPLPEEISVAQYAKLLSAAKKLDGPDSITPHADTLNRWYQPEENADPLVYMLQPRRKPEPNDPHQSDYTAPNVWSGVEQLLWRIINHELAFPPSGLRGRFDGYQPEQPPPEIVSFQASATEQEIWNGAFKVKEAKKHVFAFIREIEQPSNPFGTDEAAAKKYATAIKDYFDIDSTGTQIDPGPQASLDELRKHIKDHLGVNAIDLTEGRKATLAISEKEKPDGKADPSSATTEVTVSLSTEHLDRLCEDLKTRLKKIIEEQIKTFWDREKLVDSDREGQADQPLGEQEAAKLAARELKIELQEHSRFAEERGNEKLFVGRVNDKTRILEYLSNASRLPFVVQGASGCGKTALLARAALEAPSATQPIVRFIGITPRSSDIRSLLRSLCQELRERNPQSEPLPTDIRDLSQEFRKHLDSASKQKPVTLILDAADQLADADNGLRLYWIPFGQLPEYVKIVVSCLSDRDESKDIAAQPFISLRQRRLPPENVIDLDALSPEDASILLFHKWLPSVGRKVSEVQQKVIEAALHPDECRNPLYLKLILEEVRHWRATDVGRRLEQPSPAEVSKTENSRERSKLFVGALLNQFIQRLRSESHHGPLMVDRALGYIAAGRRGLTENEILEVLFADEDYKLSLEESSKKNKHVFPEVPPRIPIAIWSRLRSDLAPFLTERSAPGGSVIAFYHRQIAEWIHNEFVIKATWPSHGADPGESSPHSRLARYFAKQDYFLESLEKQRARARRLPPTPRPSNIRKVDELPWQLLQVAKRADPESKNPKAKEWDAIAELFTDIHFLESKSEAAE